MLELLPAILFSAGSVVASTPQVVVGENVRVSRDDTPYGEPYIARHPSLSGRLIGIASKFKGSAPVVPVVFVSADGGATSQEKPLPVGAVAHAVDCWVAFSDTGIAYASALIIEINDPKTVIAMFRSGDAG